MNSEDLIELRARWDRPEGKALLERLWSEKIRLKNFEDAIAAVKKAFDVHDLRGVNFSGLSMMDQFLLLDVDLSYSDFSRSFIYGSFQYSTVRYSSFDRAQIRYGTFNNADLTGASFRAANIEGADFSGSTLDNASFQDALLDDVHFYNVDLTAVNFEGACLGAVNFHGVKMLRSPCLEDLVASSSRILFRKIDWI